MESSAIREFSDHILSLDRSLRSNSQDPVWILNNQMGLKSLWLIEWVRERIPLVPEGQLPEHMLLFRAQECRTWHTVDWWRRHRERTGFVAEVYADVLPDGW